MSQRFLCIYHGNCADGFTAAWAVNLWFGPGNVEFHPGVHGEGPPNVAGRDVIVVDFSYKRPIIEAIAGVANSVLILDHHKTAETDLAGLPAPPPFGEWRAEAFLSGEGTPDGHGGRRYLKDGHRLAALFDMERSGAQIAWDYFRQTSRPSRLVDYVADRDLWRFKLPDSRAVSAYIFAHEYTFENWDTLDIEIERSVDEVAAAGAAIEKKHHKDIAELVANNRRRMVIGGIEVWVANLPYTLASDAGNLMAKGQPFAACYWDTPKGRVFSLRSTDHGMDVSAIAASYGGGGHVRASGFQRPLGWEGDKL